RIQQKGDNKCIFWKNLKDIILTHLDTKKRVDVFALSIYDLVVFPKALGHTDEAVTNLFDRLDKRVTPVPMILAETFRSLNAHQRADEVATPRRDDISEEKWMVILQNLCEEDVEWRAPWLLLDEILYQCGDFDWVPLLGIWGAVGYAPLLTRRMKRLVVGPMTTPEYNEWWVRRINDNIHELSNENSQSIICKKTKVKEDLDSLKTDYKKLRLSMRTVGMGKTSEQWREKVQEEKNKANRWEKKFQENSAMELRASLRKIEEMKERIEQLETALHNCEIRIEYLEANEDRYEQLHYFQNQVRSRDHITGEIVVQIREVADHLQTLAVQADMLSVKYELESSRGQELSSLLREIRVLSIRAKPYL
ncbi:hypothetical protein Goshw_017525, partial [Gossypium schwendimanii]|nr:hypothetical protein [Gossypium schwendimanii]